MFDADGVVQQLATPTNVLLDEGGQERSRRQNSVDMLTPAVNAGGEEERNSNDHVGPLSGNISHITHGRVVQHTDRFSHYVSGSARITMALRLSDGSITSSRALVASSMLTGWSN